MSHISYTERERRVGAALAEASRQVGAFGRGRAWVLPDPIADYDRPDHRTITVHEDEPAVDTGILGPDGNMIRRRVMRPIGFVQHGQR